MTVERLESRYLLDGALHNHAHPFDVNDDGLVTPLDAKNGMDDEDLDEVVDDDDEKHSLFARSRLRSLANGRFSPLDIYVLTSRMPGMARPKHEQPTPAELEVLKILWERGTLTVREVLETLNQDGRERAYTSVMSLMNVMTDKGLLDRRPVGRAFEYTAAAQRERTLGQMVGDLLGRAFEGSASALVAQLLDEANPDADELEQIRQAIAEYKKQPGA